MADSLLAQQLQAEEQQGALFTPQASPHGALVQNANALFLKQLSAGSAQVQEYEDNLLQALALSALPNHIVHALEAEHVEQDDLARALMSWFKQEFFTWVTKPDCLDCGLSDTNFTGAAPAATAEEVEGRCRQVEKYVCTKCGCVTRFPRYNHPGKLLETRRGRCGEFANAFTLICRAAGLEARWCRDWTDHVWTEFYSPRQGRWIHLDPCENAFDQPHLYEDFRRLIANRLQAGWGKKLSYVIAFGRFGVTDVSGRYSTDLAETRQRQALIVQPEWAQQVCSQMTEELRLRMTGFNDRLWAQRDQHELSELMQQPVLPADASLPGRQTGSTEWKASRGELGAAPAAGHVMKVQPLDATEPLPSKDATASPAADEAAQPHAESTSKSILEASNLDFLVAADVDERDKSTGRMQAAFAALMASGRHAPGAAAALALGEVLDKCGKTYK